MWTDKSGTPKEAQIADRLNNVAKRIKQSKNRLEIGSKLPNLDIGQAAVLAIPTVDIGDQFNIDLQYNTLLIVKSNPGTNPINPKEGMTLDIVQMEIDYRTGKVIHAYNEHYSDFKPGELLVVAGKQPKPPTLMENATIVRAGALTEHERDWKKLETIQKPQNIHQLKLKGGDKTPPIVSAISVASSGRLQIENFSHSLLFAETDERFTKPIVKLLGEIDAFGLTRDIAKP